jgi:DNA polymerase III subunit beta
MTTATMTKPRRARSTGISLSTSSLKAALAAVKAAVPSRSPKPVLLNVLMANGSLTASDLELQITTPIDYEGEPILLPHAKLVSILEAASGDQVTIEPKGNQCVVTVGNGSWTLPTESAAEFPVWEPTGLQPIARIPADQFVRAVKSTSYATDNESSRFALGAVLVEMNGGTLTFVGTDGRRLAAFECEVDQDTDDSTTLIPNRAAGVMASLAGHSSEAVQLEANASEVVASHDGTVVTARLVEGRFPRWRDVFPEREVPASLVIPAELRAATRQAKIVTSEQSKGVTFAFTSEGIHLTAQSAEAGQSSVTCPIEEFGHAATVKLDPSFVVDLVSSVDADEPFEVEAVDGVSAVVFRSGDVRAVILPLADD